MDQVGYNRVDEVRFWTYLKVKAIGLDVVCERKIVREAGLGDKINFVHHKF